MEELMVISGRVLIILLTAVILVFPTEGAAQQLSVSGTVRDPAGVAPEAEVTLRPAGGTATRNAKTDGQGRFSFTGLTAGYYEISFAKAGFDALTRQFTLGPDTGPIDVTFALGAVTTSI